MPDEEPRPLRAVPAPPGDEIAPGPPVYADITDPGARRPVLPDWLRSREQFRATTRRRAGYEWYRARFHGLRLPVYAALTVFWGVAGAVWMSLLWLRWWLSPVPATAQLQAAEQGWREWKSLHHTHRQATRVRAWISGGVLVAVLTAWGIAWADARWLAWAGLAAAMIASAVLGRPEGVHIVTPARVPSQYERLTPDIIVRALGSLGLAKIDRWLREDKDIEFIAPGVRQDGPGWRAELNLPYGATATEVIDRREQLASGLRRPLGSVWPEPVTSEHTGRLELWVGQEDVARRKPVPWPLLRSGTVDVFKPVPVGTDTRGRGVKGPLIYHNWLIGSMPGNGKTGTVRELNAAIALDALCEQQVHELKGTGDLDPFEPLCTRFVSGIDDESIAYAAESLKRLRSECQRRSPRIKALPLSICPEKRVTREIAEKYRLRPLACTIDECQNLFAHPVYGKAAGADAEFIIKVGRALGIFLILATQRPDKASLPTGVSGNVSIRFCLYVAGQLENDMILGTSAYQNGIRATLFRPEIDAGLGYLKGATPAPKVVKTHFLNVPETQAVVARARILRERAGTLPVPAPAEPERDVLADVLAALGTDPGLHWDVLAERLAERWPDRWASATGPAVSAQCRKLNVPSEDVRYPTDRTGTVLKGCKRDSVAGVAARNIAGQGVSV